LNFKSASNSWFSWSYITSNVHQILSATGQHVTLAVLSILLGVAIAFPLAILARGNRTRSGVAYSVSSALYAIPSLAFVYTMYGFFGLSRLTIIIPLAAYSLVILLRNILTGLDEVPAEVLDAARGVGFSRQRILWRVQLPLAMPSIIAGLRLATVSTIELAVIGGFVGLNGYGKYLNDGLDRDYHPEVVTYLLLTVLLAVVADLLILALGRALTRWRQAT
jgi:osmoprotectant transport system permease protein